MAYGDSKNLPRRTSPDKILCGKAYNITKNPKYDRDQRGLAFMVYKFFNKKTSGGAAKKESMPNQRLAEELHKAFIGKFQKEKNTHLLLVLV